MPCQNRPIAILILIAVFVAGNLFATCRYPDPNDPDEVMDAIGKTQFCDREDRNSNPLTREDLGGGGLSSPIGAGDDGARGIVVDPFGNFILLGRTYNGSNNDFGIIRYLPDGNLDTGFDTDGKLLVTFGNGDDTGHAIVVQSDARLLVIGRSDRGTPNFYDFAIARIHTNGTLDTTFKTTGKTYVDMQGFADIARSGVLDSSGRLLIGGYTNWSKYHLSFSRLNTDGSLDTTFNSKGWTSLPHGDYDAGIMSIELDGAGNIIGGGNRYTGANWDWGVVRLNSAGNYDTAFNTTGKLSFPIGTASETAYGITSDSLNRLVLAGNMTNSTPNADFAIARVNTDGTLDTAFFTVGIRSYAHGAGDEGFNGVAMDPDRTSILAAGYYYNGSNNDFAVLRFVSNGTFDTTFGASFNGVFTQAFRSGEDTAQAIYTKESGYVVIGGRTYNGSDIDYAFMRTQKTGTLALSGEAVTWFGTSGNALGQITTTDASTYTLAGPLNQFYVLGSTGSNTRDWGIARFKYDGSLDTSFKTTGKLEYNFGGSDSPFGAFLQTDSKLLVAGAGGTAPQSHKGLRLNTDGTFDTSFNTTGTLTNTIGSMATAVIAQTDGKVVMAGFNANGTDFVMARYNTDGSLDTSFNTGAGTARLDLGLTDNAYFVLMQTDGGLVMGGVATNTKKTELARLLSSGGLDTTFATRGYYSVALTTSGTEQLSQGNVGTIDQNGRISMRVFADAGSAGERAHYYFRWNTDGSLDTSFQTDGTGKYTDVASSAGAAGGTFIHPNGKIHVNYDAATGFYAYRLYSNGTFDTTFGTQGKKSTGNHSTRSYFLSPNGFICADAGATGYLGIYCLWQ